MTEQVTVASVGEGNPWKDEITYWDVVFNRNGEDFACTWGKKGDGPVVGESVEGEFFQKNGEWKFRKASKPPSGNNRGSSEVRTGSAGSQNAGGKGGWESESERDPERSARILRQHSQGLAVQILIDKGLFRSEQPKAEELEKWITEWANFFDKDVNKVGQAAVQTSGNATPEAQEGAATSLASASPTSEQQPVDDTHQYFCRLLEDAALNPDAARALATFIVEKFDNDQRRRAETGLKHLDTQQGTLAEARVAYEKVEGDTLPSAADDDGIPF